MKFLHDEVTCKCFHLLEKIFFNFRSEPIDRKVSLQSSQEVLNVVEQPFSQARNVFSFIGGNGRTVALDGE